VVLSVSPRARERAQRLVSRPPSSATRRWTGA
jgi:hypothetical protein